MDLKVFRRPRADTYDISRMNILSSLLQFSTYKGYKPSDDFVWQISGEPPIGALCCITSAPVTKWYCGWLVEIIPRGELNIKQYVIKSLEDGYECKWNNIGLYWLSKETTDKYPHWRWTDRQWKFQQLWFRVCYQKRDAFIKLPTYPKFNDDGSVTVSIRTRFETSTESDPKHTFKNWKKVKASDLLKFYDKHVKK